MKRHHSCTYRHNSRSTSKANNVTCPRYMAQYKYIHVETFALAFYQLASIAHTIASVSVWVPGITSSVPVVRPRSSVCIIPVSREGAVRVVCCQKFQHNGLGSNSPHNTYPTPSHRNQGTFRGQHRQGACMVRSLL